MEKKGVLAGFASNVCLCVWVEEKCVRIVNAAGKRLGLLNWNNVMLKRKKLYT